MQPAGGVGELSVEVPVPSEGGAVRLVGEVLLHHAPHAEGGVVVAFDHGPGVVGDGDGVYRVVQAVEVFVESFVGFRGRGGLRGRGLGLGFRGRIRGIGVTVAEDEVPAVQRIEEVLALWGGGVVEAFFDAAPLVVVVEVAGGAVFGQGGAASEAVVGVGGDGGAGLAVGNFDEAVPGVPLVEHGVVPVVVGGGGAGGEVAGGVVGEVLVGVGEAGDLVGGVVGAGLIEEGAAGLLDLVVLPVAEDIVGPVFFADGRGGDAREVGAGEGGCSALATGDLAEAVVSVGFGFGVAGGGVRGVAAGAAAGGVVPVVGVDFGSAVCGEPAGLDEAAKGVEAGVGDEVGTGGLAGLVEERPLERGGRVVHTHGHGDAGAGEGEFRGGDAGDAITER